MGYNDSWNTTNSSSEFIKEYLSFLEFYQRIRYAYGILVFLLIPVIIVANIILIITIVTNRNLRKEFRNLVIVSISIADVLIGLISCPIRAEVTLTNLHHHGCAAFFLVSVLEEFVQMFVGTWGIATINFDLLLAVCKVKLPQLSPFKQKLVLTLILVLPWLAMFTILLPVAYAYGWMKITFSQICYLYMYGTAKQIIVSFTYVIPALIIVCQCIVLVVLSCKWYMTSGTKRLSLLLVIASLVSIGFVGIEQCGWMALNLIFKMPPRSLVSLMYFAIFISDLKSAVTPLIWFTIPELRAAFMELINKLPWRHTDNVGNVVNHTVISYREMEDE